MALDALRTGRQLLGVFDLEMIGCCRHEADSQDFPPGFRLLFPKIARWVCQRDRRGDFLAVVTNPRSNSLADALIDAGGLHALPVIAVPVRGAARLIPDFYRSDHYPFWRRGFPAVMATDSANFRNEHYHLPTDTVDTLDFDFASRVIATVLGALAFLAGRLP